MSTNSEREHGTFCGRTRREFLWEAGGGFTGVALASMLAGDGFLANQARAADGTTPFEATGNPLAPQRPHFAPKAKTVPSRRKIRAVWRWPEATSFTVPRRIAST